MKKLVYGLLFMCFSLCLVVGTTLAAGQPQVASMEKMSEGIELTADPASIREKAIGSALEKIVEDVVMSFLSPENIDSNLEVIRDSVYVKAKGYIQNYSIVEEKTADGLFFVTVRAKVSVESIEKDLRRIGIISTDEDLPRTVILIGERKLGATSLRYNLRAPEPSVTERVFRTRFLEEGYGVVDREAVSNVIGYMGLDTSSTQIAYFGRQLKADLVVVGEVTVDAEVSENVSEKIFVSRCHGRAIRASDGVIISEVGAEAKLVSDAEDSGSSKAMALAAGKAAETVKEEIKERWQKSVAESLAVSFVIRGIKGYADYAKISETLETELKEIKEIQSRYMESGKVVLGTRVEGNTLAIADSLAVKAFRDFSLEIINVTEDMIEIQIIK